MGYGPEFIPDPEVVTRDEWGALPARSTERLGRQIRYLVVTLNTDTPHCTTKESCIEIVRELQKRHMDMGLSDIPYNFLIGCDGLVYEGRGWRAKSSSTLHKPEGLPHGKRRLDIAFIGDFRYNEHPPNELLDPTIMLINYGITNLHLKKKYEYFELDKRYVKEDDD